jgi:ATP-dependent RNA helicase DDX19/DBP5
MVVNYDLPLMNERDKTADERPDVETYIHRIGLFSAHNEGDTELIVIIGRTGRFGRRGISINFVHDKKTWLQMEQIEQALGKRIIRIETKNLDEMEEVRLPLVSNRILTHLCA